MCCVRALGIWLRGRWSMWSVCRLVGFLIPCADELRFPGYCGMCAPDMRIVGAYGVCTGVPGYQACVYIQLAENGLRGML